MSKAGYISEAQFISIDTTKKGELWRQVYDEIREKILDGRLRPGDRIMSSRMLADIMGISRVTVLKAFEQLKVEGYINQKTGFGTFISSDIPDYAIQITPGSSHNKEELEDTIPPATSFGKFYPGVPDIDNFPFEKWSRVTSRVVRSLPVSLFNSYDCQGYLPLRDLLAAHLREYRGLSIAAQDIVITSSINDSLTKLFHSLFKKGDIIWVDDPGYGVTLRLFRNLGLNVRSLDLQGDYINLPEAKSKLPRAIYLTPSHQYPLGNSLPLEKRLKLIEFAMKHGVYLIEDDYDSVYRFREKPIRALHALNKGQHTIYLGSMSKILFLGLRISFMVIPASCNKAVLEYQRTSSKGLSVLEQAILAEFMAKGYFDQHIRKTRALYDRKYNLMVTVLQQHLSDFIDIEPTHTGIHFVCLFKKEWDDVNFVSFALKRGFALVALSSLYIDRSKVKRGIVIGYGNVPERIIQEEARKLAQCFLSFVRSIDAI